jgi:hypothetical protein
MMTSAWRDKVETGFSREPRSESLMRSPDLDNHSCRMVASFLHGPPAIDGSRVDSLDELGKDQGFPAALKRSDIWRAAWA